MQDGIQERIKEMCQRLEALYAEAYKDIPFAIPRIVGQFGPKNARIVREEFNRVGEVASTSVYCFVDLSNGDILKAAGFKAPAKGKRGSIWNEDCDVGPNKPCNLHGGGLYKR